MKLGIRRCRTGVLGYDALSLIRSGAATLDPELDELKERARRQGQNVDWAEAQPRFNRPRAIGVATATNESFAAKLSKATKTFAAAYRPTTVKEWKERSEKAKERFRKLTKKRNPDNEKEER